MKKIILGCVLALSIGACDKTKEVEKFADRACECKDKDCAKKTIEDFTQWINDNQNARGDEERAMKAMNRMIDCAQKAGLSALELADAMSKLKD
jgi:hypothetical protein